MLQSEEPTQSDFLITKEYRKFVEFADACKRYRYIGLCYGPPGVGKTLSARHYAQSDILEHFRSHPTENSLPLEMGTCRTVVYTPTVSTTPKQVEKEIASLRHTLKYGVREAMCKGDESASDSLPEDCTELIIVDEADRLKFQAMEQVRDIFDKSRIGLVLIGMPGLEKRLSRYPQLYSRVGFVHEFKPLSNEEMTFIFERKWNELGLSLQQNDFTDTEAMSAVVRTTGGNFRLLHRLFMQVERVLQINELKNITKEVVEAARESLVIGVS